MAIYKSAYVYFKQCYSLTLKFIHVIHDVLQYCSEDGDTAISISKLVSSRRNPKEVG